MKIKRLIILAVLAVLAVVYIISIVPKITERADRKRIAVALQSLPRDRVEAAIQAFKRDRKTTDNVVPLQALVAGGYLRAEDVRGLVDKDVSVSVAIDQTTPSAIWIRVRTAGGSDIVLMADGSVLKVARR